MAELAFTQVPKGFQIEESPDGWPAISYRTTGMRSAGIFLCVWLGGWFATSSLAIVAALWEPPNTWPTGSIALLAFGLWTPWFVLAAHTAWYFGSKTVFSFQSERLKVERRLWCYTRKLDLQRNGITKVRQVKDGGGEDDSFPSWGLEIEGQANGTLLSKQPIDKSDWFGPIVAQWAGVGYERT